MVIELTERPYWVDSRFDLILDLLPSSQFRLNEAVQNMQGGSLSLSYALPLPVAASPKNKILLGDTKRNYLKCRVILGGQEMPITSLYWYTITETEINIDLVHAQRDWAKALEQRKLNEIEYRKNGTLTLLKPNLEDNWANGFIWTQDTPPFYLPLIRYNGLLAQQYIDIEKSIDFSKTEGNASVTYNDLRPLISVLFTMQEMFALIGYTFKSPFLESEYGRTLFSYILTKDFAKDKGVNGKFHVSYVGTSFEAYDTNAVNFNTDTGGDNYNGGQYIFVLSPPAQSHYVSPYTYPIKMTFKTNMVLSHTYGVKKIVEVTIRIMYDTDTLTNEVFDYKKEDFVIEAGQTLECLVEWENAIVLPQYRVEVRVRTFQGTTLTVHEASWFEGKMADNSYYYGDILNPQVRDDSCLDYLKGVAHICNGHFITDVARKTVTMYPPLAVEIEGEYIEGFYNIYTKELDASAPIITFSNYQNKTLKLGWKSSQDIRSQDNVNYGIKTIRLSTNETNEATNYNPYFQALFEDYVLKNASYSPIVASIVTSKDDLTQVDEVEPFIVEALGGQYQSLRHDTGYSTGATMLSRVFTLIGLITDTPTVYDLIPYATQAPTAYSFNGSPISLSHMSTYGTYLKDFSQLYYEPLVKNTKSVQILTRGINISDLLTQQGLRNKLIVNIDGKPTVIYPTKLNDFQEGITSIVEGVFDITTSPIPCDGLMLKAKYPVFTDILSGSYSFDCYLESFLINGVEQVSSQILVGNPAFMGVTDFYTTLSTIINLFVSCQYSSSNLLIETNKCFWFQITLRKGNDVTLIDQWQRFDNIGTWTNISLNSGASTDTASWKLLGNPTDKVERYV